MVEGEEEREEGEGGKRRSKKRGNQLYYISLIKSIYLFWSLLIRFFLPFTSLQIPITSQIGKNQSYSFQVVYLSFKSIWPCVIQAFCLPSKSISNEEIWFEIIGVKCYSFSVCSLLLLNNAVKALGIFAECNKVEFSASFFLLSIVNFSRYFFSSSSSSFLLPPLPHSSPLPPPTFLFHNKRVNSIDFISSCSFVTFSEFYLGNTSSFACLFRFLSHKIGYD